MHLIKLKKTYYAHSNVGAVKVSNSSVSSGSKIRLNKPSLILKAEDIKWGI
jgi:hypothetical protein